MQNHDAPAQTALQGPLDPFQYTLALGPGAFRSVRPRRPLLVSTPLHGARVILPNREQVVIPARRLDDTIPQDHFVRWIFRMVLQLDLSLFYSWIRARVGHAGRPATDPAILITLWIYAFCDGVTSARQLDELCQFHDVYRWILGQAVTNAHTLSEFRTAHCKPLMALHLSALSKMESLKLIDSSCQAQDGMRVRACAGAASFHREETTRELLSALETAPAAPTASEPAQDPVQHAQAPTAQQRAACVRAAKELKGRLTQALDLLPKLPVKKSKDGKAKEPRASSTDAEARVMKMANGGFNPAYNIQFSTTTKDKVILEFGATNQGSDKNQMIPILKKLNKQGRKPKKMLVDGGFGKKAAITEAAQMGIEVYSPEQKQKKSPANTPKAGDSPEVAEWRLRMATEPAKGLYRQRAATAELVNADLRAHGLVIRVRGTRKVRMIVAWAVIAYNLRRWHSLEQAQAAHSA